MNKVEFQDEMKLNFYYNKVLLDIISSREPGKDWYCSIHHMDIVFFHNNHPTKTWKHFYMGPPPLYNCLNFDCATIKTITMA